MASIGGTLLMSFVYLHMLSCLTWEDTMNYRKYDRIQATGVDTAIAFEEKKTLSGFWGLSVKNHGRTRGKEALCLRSSSPEPWGGLFLNH